MAERRFTARIVVPQTPGTVFDFVADYRNVRAVLDGVSRWDPVGLQTRGVGAAFDVEMRAYGFPLHNRLVLSTWEPPHAIAWRSDGGLIEQVGGWTFKPRGGGTEVTLTIAYVPPAGAVGSLVAGQVDGLVRRRLEQALARLRDEVAVAADG